VTRATPKRREQMNQSKRVPGTGAKSLKINFGHLKRMRSKALLDDLETQKTKSRIY